MDFLKNHIEALIFCSATPISENEIQNCLNEMFNTEVSMENISNSISELEDHYQKDESSFQVYKIGGGYQFLTKPAYQASIGILLKQQSKKRLSNSSLETLSIIAYKQPVTKGDIEQVRGVNCDYSVQKLLDKELVEIKGKQDAVGRPILYGTSEKFMDYFGINDLGELPTIKDFASTDNQIGEQASEETDS
ncbi:MAG: SMC-Scp complex subunit ScpB [Bacteroidetes bacterium]|nr:SMC-Scp complex subunit ScpB [Bacteroidota bacterium]MDA1120716.1 SMC-Scp complex subunit ScpB [Bacteroidota bacterium]